MIHQHQAAQAVDAGAAQNGIQGLVDDTLMHTLDHFGIGEVLTAEELVHELIAGFGNGFFQRIVELFNDGILAIGNGDLNALEILHLVGALIQHIDDAGDLLLVVPDGNHHGRDLVAVLLTQGVEGGIVVGVFLVNLGDVDEAGHIAFFAVLPCLLKADGDAVLGGNHQNGSIGSAQCFHHGAGEIETAGGVQQIDLDILVFQRNHSRGDGNMAANLFGIIVTNGVAVGVLTDTVDGTGHVEQTLGQGGLTTAGVTQQADVANSVCCVHSSVCSFREDGILHCFLFGA